MNLSEALAGCLESMRLRNSPTTFHAYDSHARAFEALWGSRPVNSITQRELEEWIARRRGQVADATVSHQLAFLKGVFSWAQEEAGLASNPAASVRARLRKNKRSRWLNFEEEARLLESFMVWNDGALHYSQARWAILTGLRRLEQLMVRPDDVFPGYVMVNRGKCGQRLVPLNEEAEGIARQWIEIATREGSPWVFWPEEQTSDPKGRCHYGFWYHSNIWIPATRRAGLRDLQWRDLRRTFACRLVKLQVPIFEIQRMLGHVHPLQTMTYCHVELEQLKESVRRLK